MIVSAPKSKSKKFKIILAPSWTDDVSLFLKILWAEYQVIEVFVK